ncbi:synaptotagmin like 3 [Homo sapiens]|uniref:Isoform 2 of Synaptotagmin-like protein 3 n=1 Tax=Homo sapiens TaxID=9606 RepID=Q4VX76-2|nr:synaptotagmin-like protein 3 isoform 2 [Homo sapiens]NP_001229324.1 synaptotagmin-like protein 3 isoform 2 [Homo sapiens]XP_047275510.1 synaptotagmin-like protein 3 isoform X2 [Homo sapiens]XP_047275511.1 synaptotagmin-like protein 3 isoform X2 [Homo sapiens]XP_047275512.1 synaptotagmin-like protein 3 isoform X2 [Homo sapiens]XP_047275513.1 synaptotagmin-like protein 3 isoform X2 [Homo sapiens]XP_047275514.1 synaptotagmin-like protein 3 isoform X2 [Homo sapiens]KAI4020414.1 synaptotagmin |eukprot:NP_001009991.2 synaptotagmin-like protein 3 isoform 2 [Homo sapiens]
MAQEIDLSALKELEREAILQVLYRDQAVQNTEEERTRKLKTHLQHLRWKGAKNTDWEHKEKCCARCQQVLGFLLHRGAVCRGCSHRVCAQCRVFLRGTHAWKCTVCFEDRNVKIKTGEWFYEERAKKFPTGGKHETVGGQLLQSYQKLSKISVVPPTPPPVSESQCSRSPGRKVSAPDILKPLNQEDPKCSTNPILKQQNLPSSPAPSTIFSGGFRHGSLISIDSTCTEMGNFDNANVTGEIEFAIHYCFKTHSLEICIKACKNLAYGEEKKKKCNPYVKTYLLPDRSSQGKRKTGVQRNTVDPTFQETLKYQVAPAQLVTRQLQVSVWHLGTLARRVFLGEVIIPLATWDFEDSTTQSFRWHPLRAKAEKYEDSVPQSNGELTVRAKLVLPSRPRKLQEAQEGTDQPSLHGQLCLVVLGAKNLPVRPDGTLNSFVKGCLTLPDQQKLRLKSPVLRKQACPQWKHSFVFSGVTPAQLRQSSLELTVWDQALFGMNDRLLGGTRLGSKGDTAVGGDACSLSKLQWQKVLSSPNLWTDMTLVLH